MNYAMVCRQLGLLVWVVSACLAGMAVFGWVEVRFEHQDDLIASVAMALGASVGVVLGLAFVMIGRWVSGRNAGTADGTAAPGGLPAVNKAETLQRRDAFLLTGTAWILGGVVAALPFYFWAQLGGATALVAHSPFAVEAVNDSGNTYLVQPGHEFESFASCYFEAVSGLTTTGATVLGERGGIDDLPRTLLLWRSLTHWLGGLGIVVLFVAVLPSVGAGAKRLFQSESSAVDGGVRPRIGETARLLWVIYTMITATAMGTFMVCGMDWFDALNHAFSVMATGGYSTKGGSIAHYDSAWLDYSVVLFMLLAGTNFAIFYRTVRGNWTAAFHDREFQVFLALKIAVTLIIAWGLWGQEIVTTAGKTIDEASATESVRYALFQTASLQTGTGFATADWDDWSRLSLALLFGLMMMGGCAGSTAGGVKVIRIIISLRVFAYAMERSYRPSVVRTVKVGGHAIDAEARTAAMTFLLLWLLILALGVFGLVLLEPNPESGGRLDPITALLASLVTLANVGPGLYEIGATKHFGWFTDGSKYLLSLMMVLGRLELFALLVLFTPRFWRGN
ncbi:MAG: TrkH family potassium uptake protein [Planctomycetota bacterium]